MPKRAFTQVCVGQIAADPMHPESSQAMLTFSVSQVRRQRQELCDDVLFAGWKPSAIIHAAFC